MIVIGVTGATGSGKSAICDLMEETYGFKIINADAIAYNASQPGSEYLKEIEKVFGKKVINKDKSLNREALGKIIFANKEEKAKLNKLTKRFVVREIEDLITIFKDISKTTEFISKFKRVMSAVVIDAPLLYEFKLDRECNYIITMKAHDDIKVDRIIKRQSLEESDARKRIESQKEYDEINNSADYIIENNGTEEELKIKMMEVIEDIARKENLKLH